MSAMFTLQPSSPDAAPSDAPASGPAAGGGAGGLGGFGSILIWVLPLLVFFFMLRGQGKKQKELESSLKVGDRVCTRGGAIGKIVKLGEKNVEIELAPGVFVTFRKTYVEGLDEPDVAKKDTAAKKDGDGKDSKDAKDAKDSKDAKDAKEAKSSKKDTKDKG